jgi:hypothetical protein
MQGTVIVYGIFTHNKYVFNDSNNHILPVDNNDLADLLAKRDVQGGCCGSPRIEKQIFILVE